MKSTRTLAAELTAQGHQVSAGTVADLLHADGFRLQANAKTVEGRQHPDRDAQFRYINNQVTVYQDGGDPVISVDAKKKETVGEFGSAGRQWRPGGDPARVRDHDFASEAEGKAIPYGIYDLAANCGWVNVGTDHNTAAFAVESIRRWWNARGCGDYPAARRLLIAADGGGSNGYRTRAWKTGLAALALETGLQITVCHFPPGTSKWNKIEHRLFSHITMNWRGRPLTSHEVIVQSIAATTTRTGLTVHAELDPGSYPAGEKISDAEMDALPLARHAWHGDWNYTLQPPAPRPAANRTGHPGLGTPRPDRAAPGAMGPAHHHRLQTARRPATRPPAPHPRRPGPHHSPQAPLPHTPRRPRQPVRRPRQHHQDRIRTGSGPTSSTPATTPRGRPPAQNPPRTHRPRPRPRPRHHTAFGNHRHQHGATSQTSVLIIRKY